MLLPKRVKYRRVHRGRMTGKATRGNTITCYLLEGMACPGGCIAGAGTLLSLDQAAKSVALEQKNAARKNPLESEFSGLAEELNEF